MARPRKKKGRPISGWLVLDKSFDLTSTEAVSKIKWLFKAQKAGHAGTLDPLASGMLPIALGQATKTVPYVMDGRKIYQFTVSWGQERTTDDLEGEVTKQSDKRASLDEIKAILPQFCGQIQQIPPQFSAIKIAGERAYDVARSGKTIEISPRQVDIFQLDILDGTDHDKTIFKIECGKGTYVRALARDFGRKLGCYGYISHLRRLCVFPFQPEQLIPLSDLVNLEKIDNDDERFGQLDTYLIDTKTALSALAHISITGEQALRLKHGNPIILRGSNMPIQEDEAYVTERGRLVALGEICQGEFRPRRIFNG